MLVIENLLHSVSEAEVINRVKKGMHIKRKIKKKEVKKEIPGLWAWQLLEKKCQTGRGQWKVLLYS